METHSVSYPRPYRRSALFRVLVIAASIIGCYATVQGCGIGYGYKRYPRTTTDYDFDLELSWEGGCLPDIETASPVQRIAIYKVKDEDEDLLVAEGLCTHERDVIVSFEYRETNGCAVGVLTDDGGSPDGGDASAGDGGLEDAGDSDAGLPVELCACTVGESWKVESGEETAHCVGRFKIVAESIDGSSTVVEYDQVFLDPDDEGEPVDNGYLGCGCTPAD